MVDRPYRSVAGGLNWSAGAYKPDIANAARVLARQSHDSCERQRRGFGRSRNCGLTFSFGESVLAVYCNDSRLRKGREMDRRPGYVRSSGNIEYLSHATLRHPAQHQSRVCGHGQRSEWIYVCQVGPVCLTTKGVLGREVGYGIVLH